MQREQGFPLAAQESLFGGWNDAMRPTTVGDDVRRLNLAALCQFTLPGPPIIYYGTEVGLSQLKPADPLEEARLPMLWGDDQDRDLLSFFQGLIALRREAYPVWRGARQTLLTDDVRGVYAYACGPYVIALNNSADAVRVKLTGLDSSRLTLALATDANAVYDADTGHASLPPYGGCVFASQ